VTGRKDFSKPHRAVAARPARKKITQDAKPEVAQDSDVARLADKVHANA
jgi:hypothetical protein